jgi:hypothetical protein
VTLTSGTSGHVNYHVALTSQKLTRHMSSPPVRWSSMAAAFESSLGRLDGKLEIGGDGDSTGGAADQEWSPE